MSDVMCEYHIRYLQVCLCHRVVGVVVVVVLACSMIWAETVWCNNDLVYQPLNGLIVPVHVDVVHYTITSRKLEDVLLSSKFTKESNSFTHCSLFSYIYSMDYIAGAVPAGPVLLSARCTVGYFKCSTYESKRQLVKFNFMHCWWIWSPECIQTELTPLCTLRISTEVRSY